MGGFWWMFESELPTSDLADAVGVGPWRVRRWYFGHKEHRPGPLRRHAHRRIRPDLLRGCYASYWLVCAKANLMALGIEEVRRRPVLAASVLSPHLPSSHQVAVAHRRFLDGFRSAASEYVSDSRNSFLPLAFFLRPSRPAWSPCHCELSSRRCRSV